MLPTGVHVEQAVKIIGTALSWQCENSQKGKARQGVQNIIPAACLGRDGCNMIMSLLYNHTDWFNTHELVGSLIILHAPFL